MGSINKLNSVINTIISLAVTCFNKAIRMVFTYFNITFLQDTNNIWLIIIDFVVCYICSYYAD